MFHNVAFMSHLHWRAAQVLRGRLSFRRSNLLVELWIASHTVLRPVQGRALAMTSFILNLLFDVLRRGDDFPLQYRQTHVRQRTGAAAFERFDARGIPSLKVVVPFIGHVFY